MNKLNFVWVLLLVFICGSSNSFSSVSFADLDTDGDGIAQDTERWLNDTFSLGKTTIDNFDSYPDTDGDGLRDLIEQYLTQTDTSANDNSASSCQQTSGTPNLTGQWGFRAWHDDDSVRSASPTSAEPFFMEQYLTSMSICHTDVSVQVYHPVLGYADSVTFDGTTLSAAWTAANISIQGTYVVDANTVLHGTLSNGNTGQLHYRSSRLSQTALTDTAYDNVSGIYGLQLKRMVDDGEIPGQVLADPFFPSSQGVELWVDGTDNVTAILYGPDGIAHSAYYIPSIGGLFSAWKDAVGNVFVMRSLFLAPPTSGVGGRLRGEILTDSDGRINFHGVAQVTRFGSFTVNSSSDGLRRQLQLTNVPTSAEAAVFSGPNGFSRSYSMADVIIRNLIQGFDQDPNVGVAGDGSTLNITQIRDRQTVAGAGSQDGVYTVSFTNSASNSVALNTTYTQPAQTSLAPAQNLRLDGMTGSQSDPLYDIDPAAGHTVTWNTVANAGLYMLSLQRVDSVSVNTIGADYLFYNQQTNQCIGVSCSVFIAPNIFLDDAEYCLSIQTRDSANSSNRSNSEDLCFNTYVANKVPSDGSDGGNCFIATAAYGSYLHNDVRVLREFRDQYLLTNKIGAAFVALYYQYSPPVADYIRDHALLRTIVRGLLAPLVLAFEYPVASILMLFALLIWSTIRYFKTIKSA